MTVADNNIGETYAFEAQRAKLTNNNDGDDNSELTNNNAHDISLQNEGHQSIKCWIKSIDTTDKETRIEFEQLRKEQKDSYR